MSIRTHRVDVEEIGHAELAEADFETPARQFIEQRKKVSLVLDLVFAEGEHFVNDCPPQIGSLAQRGVAYDIEIRIASQSEAGAQRSSAGLLNIDQQFSGVVETHSGVEGHHARRGLLIIRD